MRKTRTKPIKPPKFRIGAFVNGLQPGINPDKMNQLLDELLAEHESNPDDVVTRDEVLAEARRG